MMSRPVLLAVALAALVALGAAGHGAPADPLPEEITRVHVLFMNHLDVGFSGGANYPELLGFAHQVVDLYLNAYFPTALNTSAHFRDTNSTERFVYTTKGWLVSLMLDCPVGMGFRCPDQAAVQAFREGIVRGDISWHAFPFNTQMEFYDASMVEFALKLVQDLDETLGVPRKRVFSQRDVPGTTIGRHVSLRCSALLFLSIFA